MIFLSLFGSDWSVNLLTSGYLAWMRGCFLLLLLCLSTSLWSQSESVWIEGKVQNSKTKEAVVYATVINKRTGQGVITSESGYYTIKGAEGDEIQISFIGYKKASFKIKPLIKSYPVYLQPDVAMLDQAVIEGDNSYLYNLLIKAKKVRTLSTQRSRTYFQLVNHINDEQSELLEAYYNGTFRGGNVQYKEMKHGRLGIRPAHQTMHFSKSSSRTFEMQDLWERNFYFPHGPLEYKASKMKKRFDLRLIGKSRNESNRVVYHIGFEPKSKPDWFFEGECWIDSISNQLLKIDLNIKNADLHPFISIIPTDTIKEVDMRISRTFELVGNETRFHHMDFDYRVLYYPENRSPYTTQTEAVLFAYDDDSLFVLPKVDLDIDDASDYRKIMAHYYNQVFWQEVADFNLSDEGNQNEQFLALPDVYDEFELFRQRAWETGEETLLEGGFYFWSQNRIYGLTHIESSDSTVNFWDVSEREVPYFLDAKLYMDINQTSYGLDFHTIAFLDPYTSYWNLPMNNRARCFINQYFDLTETARRDLELKLEKVNTIKEAEALFEEAKADLIERQRKYIRDVDQGESWEKFMLWNDRIYEQLEVDNIKLFGVEEPEK